MLKSRRQALHRRVGRADSRPSLFVARIGLARRQTGYVQGEPPGGRKTRGALMRKAALAQGCDDETAEIFRRSREHAGGNFLGKKLEQKVGHRRFNTARRPRRLSGQ